jgi:glycosidase
MKKTSLSLLTAFAVAATSCANLGKSENNRKPQSETDAYMSLNLAAGTSVLYEVQVRSANACDPTVGADWQKAQCQAKAAPKVTYRAEGMSCGSIGDLSRIKLGTLEDLLNDTADYRTAISLRYIHDRVGANVVWLMPLFPNNDTWNIPDACDNLGSPYAVRDYMHVSGMASQACIAKGTDEHNDDSPCWGNDSLDKVIQTAHGKGLKIMLDVAFNHFGHNYQMYDYADYTPVRDRIAKGEDINGLWNYDATYEGNLVHPRIIDTQDALESLAKTSPYHQTNLAAFKQKCPNLSGQPLVRSYHMWLNALDWERGSFKCTGDPLEFEDPGFYLGSDSFNPSSHVGDNFTNNWTDVKFLFHHEENVAHQWEFVRNREYLFRIVNYWVSRGVDGFRFDHTTDPNGGMGPNEWKYILSKVDYYAAKRGQSQPIYLAEEFGDQMGMSHVIDVMTDGYVGNMCGRTGVTKDAAYVENVVSNNDRFQGHTYVMSALETHDEQRLLNGTGFDMWTGAGFWGIGATTWSTPMLLMGQEFGESWGLGFRRSDFLRSRFIGTGNYVQAGDQLVDYYGSLIKSRLSYSNRALYSSNRSFLRQKNDPDVGPDPRIFAEAKWTTDGNVVFAFHNLWSQSVGQSYFIPPDIAGQMSINDGASYRLIDVISNQQQGNCVSGSDLKWNFPVFMNASTRAQWLRLELCN